MQKESVRTSVGLFVVLSHFVSILAVLVFFGLGGFDFTQMTTTILIIVPMFGLYTTAIVTHIVGHPLQSKRRGQAVAGRYVFVSCAGRKAGMTSRFASITTVTRTTPKWISSWRHRPTAAARPSRWVDIMSKSFYIRNVKRL